jgi:hypothetical protein
MLSVRLQYEEKFKDRMPSQIGKLLSDTLLWDYADEAMLQAMRTGKPIKDWMTLYNELWDKYFEK